MPKIRQHTVSRFYLENFLAQGATHLVQYSRANASTARVALRNASVEKRFYSVRNDDGSYNDLVEDLLADIESDAAPCIRQLIDQGDLSGPNRGILATFIGIMMIRVQGIRRHYEQEFARLPQNPAVAQRMLNDARDSLKRRGYSAEDVARMEQEIEADGGISIDKDILKRMHLERMWKSGAQRFAPRIEEMCWLVEKGPPGCDFLTSDNPVVARDPRRLHAPFIVGLDREDLAVEVSFPLSRAACLVASWRKARRTTKVSK